MADKKITAMTALSGATAVGTDIIPIVDLSEADASKNKKITVDELKKQGTIFTPLGVSTDWDGSYASKELNSNTALTFSSTKKSGILLVYQDSTGGRLLTINGTSITLNSAANSRTIVAFMYVETLLDYVFTSETSVFTVSGGVGDVTAPVLVSATVEDASDTLIVLTYNEALDTGSIPDIADFSITVNAGAATILSIDVVGSTVVLEIDTAVVFGDTLDIDYVAGTNPIQDVAGNDAANLSGQVITNNVAGGGGGYDADAAAYFAAVATAGVTLSTPEKDAYNAWVLAEKSASRYTKYSAIYPIMGGTAAAHAINAKNPGTYNLTYNGTVAHTASGLRAAGTAGDYAQAGLRPSDFSQDSIHIGIYVNDDNITNGYDMGAYSASGVALGRAGTDGYSSNNTASQPVTVADVLGMNISTRVISSEFHYVKAGTVHTHVIASSGAAPVYFAIGIIAGLYALPSTRRYAFATIGTGLTSTEAQGLNTNTNTLQTALGRA